MKKLFAFTLTEIMIAVAIIGVISAMTVPTLVNNYQKNANVVQLRKVLNDISTAIDLITTEEGKTKFGNTSVFKKDNGLNNFVKNKLKVTNTCEADEPEGCFASEKYISIDGSKEEEFTCTEKSYTLANGAALCITKRGDAQSEYGEELVIKIDTNGSEGPNIGGRDMFTVYYYNDGIHGKDFADFNYRPEGDECEEIDCNAYNEARLSRNNCVKNAFGYNCYSELLDNNWKMNY